MKKRYIVLLLSDMKRERGSLPGYNYRITPMKNKYENECKKNENGCIILEMFSIKIKKPRKRFASM